MAMVRSLPSMVLLNVLQLQKKQQIYSASMDLVILVLVLDLLEVEIFQLLVVLRKLLHPIHQKMYQPSNFVVLLEIQEFYLLTLGKEIYSLLMVEILEFSILTLVLDDSSDLTARKKQERMYTMVEFVLIFQIMIMDSYVANVSQLKVYRELLMELLPRVLLRLILEMSLPLIAHTELNLMTELPIHSTIMI